MCIYCYLVPLSIYSVEMDAFSVLHAQIGRSALVTRSMLGHAKRFFDHKSCCEHIYLILQGYISVLLSTNKNVFTEARCPFFNPKINYFSIYGSDCSGVFCLLEI